MANSGLLVANNYFYIEDDCRLNFEFTNEHKLSYIVPIKSDMVCTGPGAASLHKVLEAQGQREDYPTGKCTMLLHNVREYVKHGAAKLTIDDIKSYKAEDEKKYDMSSKPIEPQLKDTSSVTTPTTSTSLLLNPNDSPELQAATSL